MKGKILVWLLATVLLNASSAEGQQKIYRIGYLSTAAPAASNREAFLGGMRQLGYVENQNLLIEYRSAEGRDERVPDLAADLVRLKVDVILAAGTQATLAARNATASIPIVTPGSSGLFIKGIAETLARPGGNVTGISTMGVELSDKRLELFRETFPKLRRLAVLWFREGNVDFQEIRNAAQPFGFNSISLEVARPEDFDRAFTVAGQERAEGLFVATSAFLASQRKRIIDFAAKSRVPATYFQDNFVLDGGLMSYSRNTNDSFRHAAIFVDKILKGAKPADLPIEQPRKFELWFNLKTAKQIGVKIPPNVLARADKVIK
jgi:putative ABC transport system substrate-binding protein